MAADNIELQGPVGPATKFKKSENSGFRMESKKAVCPENKVAERNTILENGKVMNARFSPKDCTNCSRSALCKPQLRGKQISFRVPNQTLAERRQKMGTEAFKNDMHSRNGIEGTLSGLIRGQGLRTSRYRGKNKTRLQIKFSAAAANIKRLHRKKAADLEKLAKWAA